MFFSCTSSLQAWSCSGKYLFKSKKSFLEWKGDDVSVQCKERKLLWAAFKAVVYHPFPKAFLDWTILLILVSVPKFLSGAELRSFSSPQNMPKGEGGRQKCLQGLGVWSRHGMWPYNTLTEKQLWFKRRSVVQFITDLLSLAIKGDQLIAWGKITPVSEQKDSGWEEFLGSSHIVRSM